jgi:hypothetical protein
MATDKTEPVVTVARRSIGRRRLFQAGGVAVALSAVLAACADDDGDATKRPRPPKEVRRDITITRTASSLEHVAVVVYSTMLESGLVTTRELGALLQQFRSHHEEHAVVFEGVTRELGGTAYDEANPAVLEQLKPFLNALQDELAVIGLALNLENIVAHTYQSNAGAYRDPALTVAAMSVGGVEARHAAAMAAILNQVAVPEAFQKAQQAIPAGTGL